MIVDIVGLFSTIFLSVFCSVLFNALSPFFLSFLKIFIYLFGCIGSQLQHAGSLVVACEPLVAACGIQFPNQGSNLGALHWERGVFATGPPGKSLLLLFKMSNFRFTAKVRGMYSDFSYILCSPKWVAFPTLNIPH